MNGSDLFRFDRLDRYVMRCFFTSLLVVFVFFFGFFNVIDLFTNADGFVETAKQLDIPARKMVLWVAGLYLYMAPSVFLQVAPFVTVIGGLVAVARMNRANELVPVLMSGRSIFRMLRPVFLCAGGLMVLMLLVQEFVAPAASDHRLALWSYLRHRDSAVEIHAQLTDNAGYRWSKMSYDTLSGTLVTASLVRIADNGRVERAKLANAHYDPVHRGWRMEGGVTVVSDDDALGHREERVDLFTSSLTPRQITAQEKDPFDLSLAELGDLFSVTQQARFQVLMHYHVTFPITNLLLLLLTIPFVLRYDRQKVMQGFAIAFFLCVAYFGVDSALRTLGESRLHPVLAAWFAPLFFGALGIALFDGVRT